MIVIIDVEKIHFSHIKEVLLYCEKLELKKDTLSVMTYSYCAFDIMYKIFHNKKSFTITSEERLK